MDFADAALVLCAHGIRGGPGIAAEHTRAIGKLGLFGEVHACAHKGAPCLEETMARIGARTIRFVPLLMAEAYTLDAMLAKLEQCRPADREVVVCRPPGIHPALAELMADRARSTLGDEGWPIEDTALLVVGHGTERHARSSESARAHAARIRAAHPFKEVTVAFLDEEPTVPETIARLDPRFCVAEGFFVDRGEHGEEDIPDLLATTGRETLYTGPVGCEPAMVKLILDQVTRAERGARAAA